MHAKHIVKLGTGATAVLFISRLMTTNAMFTSAEAIITFNILAGLLFGLLGALAIFFFGFLGKKVRNQFGEDHSLHTLLRVRLSQKNVNRLFGVIGISYILDFLLLGIGASIILYAGFHIPVTLGVLLFLAVGLPIILFRSLHFIGNYSIYKIGLFCSIVIIIFVYLFLSKDLEAMYFGMRLYHPYLFALQLKELFYFSIVVFLIFLGKTILDLGSWNLLFQVKRGKIQRSFIFAGLIWATIPLSFSITIFPALYQGGFDNLHTIFYDLLIIFQSSVLKISFTVIVLITLVATYYTRLQEFLELVEKEFDHPKKEVRLLASLAMIVALMIGFFIFKPSVLELFFFIGVIHVSLLLPMLVILFVENNRVISYMPVIGIISTGLGLTLLFFNHPFTSILVTFATSSLLIGGSYFYFRVRVAR